MKIKEHNVTTGEIFEREMTDAELAQRKLDETEAQIKASEEVQTTSAKLALLEKLGITEEEAKLLLL